MTEINAAVVSAASPTMAEIGRVVADRLLHFNFEDGALIIQIPQVPPHLMESKIARNRGYFAYPPQSLFYLGAVFDQLDVPNALLDLNYIALDAACRDLDPRLAWEQAIDAAMDRFQQPFVCVSFMFDPTYPQLLSVVEYIKGKWPQSCVAVGGVAATADPERVLRHGKADCVFSNEGERPLAAFYDFLRNAAPPPPNLSLLNDNGDLISTSVTTGGEVDLDIRQQYSKLPIARYHEIGSLNNFSRMRGIDVPYATVISRRGCRAKCTFCAVRNFNGKNVRIRQTANVVDEMVHLHDVHGVRHFDWLDDDLLYNHDAAHELFQEIGHRLPDITWGAHNGLIAAAVTPALLEAMQNSGCIGFGVGLETGNPELLRSIRKPATIKTFFEFADLSKNYPRLQYLVNFILGLPNETFGQMLDSFAVSTRAALDWNNFFTFRPLKNTDAYLAYGGMDDGRADEDVRQRGTTMNFNPVRDGSIQRLDERADLASGYHVFDLDPMSLPGPEQLKEIWFTFNYLANFLRIPAATTDSEQRVRNAIRWLTALGTAYEDNPAIDCVQSYLHHRQNDTAATQAAKSKAIEKLKRSPYWQTRDRQFAFSAFLDGALPPLDTRAIAHFGRTT
ncbi:MAG: radical SAM [Rhodospirillaceae bacterium]|nr:MAG: radical SAM [Rhodospirillaceae bacterium]TNC97445.1 MAG: radical SAM protein [Stygiobacter sp.]